jgi:N-carbamoyl-L-amino-acid hydrolase
VEADGLATIGALRTEPGTPTAIADHVRLTLDLRHRDRDTLVGLDEACAAAAGPDARYRAVWSIDPIGFDADLVARAVAATGGRAPLTSGPLHDAAAVSRAGVPTVMLFARTLGGTSHSREEDAREEDLVAAIDAYGALVAELVS